MTRARVSSVANLVYCDHRLVLDRRHYESWRAIQHAYPDYKTSLGPWSEEDIVAFFRDDFPPNESHWPFSQPTLSAFFESNTEVLECLDSQAD